LPKSYIMLATGNHIQPRRIPHEGFPPGLAQNFQLPVLRRCCRGHRLALPHLRFRSATEGRRRGGPHRTLRARLRRRSHHGRNGRRQIDAAETPAVHEPPIAWWGGHPSALCLRGRRRCSLRTSAGGWCRNRRATDHHQLRRGVLDRSRLPRRRSRRPSVVFRAADERPRNVRGAAFR
jgi:hypothetical protein